MGLSQGNLIKEKDFANVVIILILAILFLPFPEQIAVEKVCTHGEVLDISKRTTYRPWVFSLFLSSSIKESTICPNHLKEENRHFSLGLDYFSNGIYEKAISEFSRLTFLNPKYPRAQKYISICLKKTYGKQERNEKFLSLRGYENLLPESINGFHLYSKFLSMEEGIEFLAGCYYPAQSSSIKKIEVSIYRASSASIASNFAKSMVRTRYSEKLSNLKGENFEIYFGYREPYHAACFTVKDFVFEVNAFGSADTRDIRKFLKEFCEKLENNARLSI